MLRMLRVRACGHETGSPVHMPTEIRQTSEHGLIVAWVSESNSLIASFDG